MVSVRFHYVRDPARAEELAQDVFVKLYRAADRYQPSARFRTFLYRIAANHCLNELRRGEYAARAAQGQDGRPPTRTPSPPAPPATPPWRGTSSRPRRKTLLDRLPEKQRAAFGAGPLRGALLRGDRRGAGDQRLRGEVPGHRATVAAAAASAPSGQPSSREHRRCRREAPGRRPHRPRRRRAPARPRRRGAQPPRRLRVLPRRAPASPRRSCFRSARWPRRPSPRPGSPPA